jgi:hypothetical protein
MQPAEIFTGVLIFKSLAAWRLYKSFGVKGLMKVVILFVVILSNNNLSAVSDFRALQIHHFFTSRESNLSFWSGLYFNCPYTTYTKIPKISTL